jgi:hypothetical protein
MGRPLPTASSKAWDSGGGGKSLHARQQRQRKLQGVSHPRTWRRALGEAMMRASSWMSTSLTGTFRPASSV